MTPEIKKAVGNYYHIWTHFKVSGDFPDVSGDAAKVLSSLWAANFNKTQKEINQHLNCSGCFWDMIKQLFNDYEAAMKQEVVNQVKSNYPNKKK